MTDLVLALSKADASAATAIEAHHAELTGALAASVETVLVAAARGDSAAVAAAQDRLVGWVGEELLPHAAAEEAALYPAAHGTESGRLLIQAMLAEHEELTVLVAEVADATDGVRAAAAARALLAQFSSHVRKENELILPLLQATSGVSLAALLDGMHEELEEVAGLDAELTPAGHGACGCGHVDAPGFPELDARAVPHAIRHATIFGALSSVAAGGGLVLVAPHDPLPLLAQIEQRWPALFTVRYLERGPQDWRLEFSRAGGRSDAA